MLLILGRHVTVPRIRLCLSLIALTQKLHGFIRYSSQPEHVHYDVRSTAIIEDLTTSLLRESHWPPEPKLERGTIHLHVSFGPVPSKNNWQLPNFIKQRRRSSGSSLPDLSVEKKAKHSTSVPVQSALWGNLVSNISVYLPEGLGLRITIKLLDDDLGFSYANSLIIHEGSISRDPRGEVIWGLESDGVIWGHETDNSWEFVFGEPDEVIMRNAVRQPSLPAVSHEVRYGLKKFPWESFGSIIVRVSNFTSAMRELMRDLGYPERKIYVGHHRPLFNALSDAIGRIQPPIGCPDWSPLILPMWKSKCFTIPPTSTVHQYFSNPWGTRKSSRLPATTLNSPDYSSASNPCTAIQSKKKPFACGRPTWPESARRASTDPP
jgi:hypothetical protein